MRRGASLRLVAQQLSCSSFDEVQLHAGQADNPLKLVFERVVVIIQPVLDPQFGRGTGKEKAPMASLPCSSIGRNEGRGPVYLGGRAS